MESKELETKTIPSLTKTISQVKINQFESCGIRERENIHNSPELAKQRLGTTYPIASGRMSIAFASQMMREYFGPEAFHHTGVVTLKFLRPVQEGDTATIGISDHAQEQLGDVVYVELPEEGAVFAEGAQAATVESGKAASEIYAPRAGEVVEVNGARNADPGRGKREPLGDGACSPVKVAHAVACPPRPR